MTYHEITIGTIVTISLFIIAILLKKKDSSGKAYSNHIKNLVDVIHSNTTTEGYIKQKTGQESHTVGFIGDGLGILKIGMLSGNGNPYVTYLLGTHKYSEDLECGKKYYKYFGNDTFKIMEELWGKDFALERNNEIKKVLYG